VTLVTLPPLHVDADAVQPCPVAKELGEDVDFLFDVAIEMEPEDGVIWVHGLEDESVMAFTDFAVDSLVELIKIHRETTLRGER
jgi:hypothetical protein